MCLKIFYILVLVILTGSVIKLTTLVLIDFDNQRKFEKFIATYNKSYAKNVNETEYYKRFRNFEESVDTIEVLNSIGTKNNSAIYGITEFSDLTRDEFHAQMLMKRKSLKTLRSRASISAFRKIRATDDGLPVSFNWIDQGVVTPIRNQGSCGACWAHSVIETIETMLAIAHNGTVRELSVQQMVDCAINNHGCFGGDTCNLLHWLQVKDVPILPMQMYPTTNSQSKCEMNSNKESIVEYTTVKGFTCQSLVNQEHRILEYLATTGPVTVGINALNWQYYLGGIIQHHCDGNPATLNHAVQIVGYDRTGEVPFYIIRNSWGKDFGDHGFAKIEIGRNLCGIATQVSTVTVK